LEEKGVKISRDNELMQACGHCFEEALELGKQVKHHSGEEGIDELWGEPFRAFTIPLDKYYESRFIKVAQTMANIDRLHAVIVETFADRPEFRDVKRLLDNYAEAAKHECETMKSDECIFSIWPRFVATGEALGDYSPRLQNGCSRECQYVIESAHQTLIAGRDLISWIARARVPMPGSTARFTDRCASVQDDMKGCV